MTQKFEILKYSQEFFNGSSIWSSIGSHQDYFLLAIYTSYSIIQSHSGCLALLPLKGNLKIQILIRIFLRSPSSSTLRICKCCQLRNYLINQSAWSAYIRLVFKHWQHMAQEHCQIWSWWSLWVWPSGLQHNWAWATLNHWANGPSTFLSRTQPSWAQFGSTTTPEIPPSQISLDLLFKLLCTGRRVYRNKDIMSILWWNWD